LASLSQRKVLRSSCNSYGAISDTGNRVQQEGNKMGNKIDLAGRIAVVTGGAQGFGKAITERFVQSGAKVAIWDRDTALAEKTAKALGDNVVAWACDVGDPASVAAARERHSSGSGASIS
jgi:NADP-dependent 3-hydroxy acid dehydrogenase YdfG